MSKQTIHAEHHSGLNDRCTGYDGRAAWVAHSVVNVGGGEDVYSDVHTSTTSEKPAGIRFRCPCCGYRTLEAPAAMMLCPVCWWEDDGQEDEDASEVRLTVNGHLSLTEARNSYASCGPADPRFLPYVRKAYVTEE